MIFSRGKTAPSNNQLTSVFNALGDKTRFALLSILSKDEEICVSELAQKVGISNAGVSQQLKILEQVGLIKRKRRGQKICYEVKVEDSVIKKIVKLISA